MNAIKTLVIICIPIVLQNISKVIPSKNAESSNNHFGVAKGNNKINKIYKYGLNKLPICKLFKTNTCNKMSKTKRPIFLKSKLLTW